MLSALAFALLGLVIILTMPLPAWSRSVAVFIWLGYSTLGGLTLSRHYQRIVGYRLYADGSIDLTHRDGSHSTGRLAAGTVLLPRLGWLRVRGSGRSAWGELVVGDCRTSEQWRRFQVICRHVVAC